MSDLANLVLPLIRTRAEVDSYGVANAHGRQMHEAIDLLQAADTAYLPQEVYEVTHKALASAVTVIARADDSSGIIGDACSRLLDLHPIAAARAGVPASRLVEWMIRFQFDDKVDYFTLDPVAYALALGDRGLRAYRAKLEQRRAMLGPLPAADQFWTSPHAHTWWVLEWNARRLAVLDRDIEEIIRTHARDRKVAAWLHDTAEAFAEIGEHDRAIDWAKRAADFDHGHQSLKAADYWCQLLADHRPDDLIHARLEVFRRWPSSTTAARLHEAAGPRWPQHHDEVLTTLASRPRDAVLFALHTLKDTQLAWNLAHSLALTDNDTWERLATAYQKTDRLAVLPVLTRLVEAELVEAGAQHYRLAARRLAKMRNLARDTPQSAQVDRLIAGLRDTHRRRPRLQQEFDRAGLP